MYLVNEMTATENLHIVMDNIVNVINPNDGKKTEGWFCTLYINREKLFVVCKSSLPLAICHTYLKWKHGAHEL